MQQTETEVQIEGESLIGAVPRILGSGFIGHRRHNGNRHRASTDEVSEVKNARPDASVHGFVIGQFSYAVPPRGSRSWLHAPILMHSGNIVSDILRI